MEGYIKLYRKLLENPVVCKDGDHLAVWVYLLLSATHKETPTWFKGQKTVLLPGQLITGRKAISQKLEISESKIHRILVCFEIEHQIEQQTSSQNRLISILNWSEYQSAEQQIERQMNNERTTSEQRVNTNKNVKNLKNVKNERNINPLTPFDSAIENFKAFRKEIKSPMSERAVELLITNLQKLAGDDEQKKIAILEQSIFRGWKGVFALKDELPERRADGRNQQDTADDAAKRWNLPE